ncbi:MAG: MFS transporter [Phycisphaerae bacterium]|nr:MFS transporter [Phycisphaerae bacterium]
MNKSNDTLKTQWAKLIGITMVHFLTDTLAGMYPAVMPDIMREFSWDLRRANMVFSILIIVCNAGQVFICNLRQHNSKPFFLQFGICAGTAICFLCFLAGVPGAFYITCALAIITGCGIAAAHPEGLRAVHDLDSIPSPISTAVFMTGGAFGFASGGLVGSFFVTLFGLKGLLCFIVPAIVSVIIVYLLKIRLAVEPAVNENAEQQKNIEAKTAMPFWPILWMAVASTTASVILVFLLPTRLQQLGFDRNFGGFSTMMFGMGGAVGSLVWSVIANKKGQMLVASISFFLGVPILLGYMLLKEHQSAVYLLFASGFCSWAGFPLLVSMSRKARGLSLGMRMGLMVGGTWGISAVFEMLLVYIAQPLAIGVNSLLYFTPACFTIASFMGLMIMLDRRKKGLPQI